MGGGEGMAVIKLTQVLNSHELNEIITLRVNEEFERFKRIFPNQADEELQVWIDLMSDDGYDIIDDPIAITASQAQWLLRDFYRRPKKEWVKIKQPK